MREPKIKTSLFWGMIGCALLAAMVIGCGSDAGASATEGKVRIVVDIAYLEDGVERHRLDICAPEKADRAKVLLFVPGGAWRQGDKGQYAEMGTTLASHYGFVVAVINYRLSNEADGMAIHPDHVNDVALSFKWVVENIGGYGGDPNSVFLFGQSAGAHLVSLLATDNTFLKAVGYDLSSIRGVIAMSVVFALSDFVSYPANPLNLELNDTRLYKAIFANAFGSWEESVIGPASPARHVNASQPPFLLIHTECDMPGFVEDAIHFHDRILSMKASSVEIRGLARSDYSDETWSKASELAALEPLLADYVGHYAEVVAINDKEYDKAPVTWIVDFLQ